LFSASLKCVILRFSGSSGRSIIEIEAFRAERGSLFNA
jgi:hypothetical protein